MAYLKKSTEFRLTGKVTDIYLDVGEWHNSGHSLKWKEGYVQLHIGWLPDAELPPDDGLMYNARVRIIFEHNDDNQAPETKKFGVVTVANFKSLAGKFVTITGQIFILNYDDKWGLELVADSVDIL
ncbi:hypothetical protein K1728_05820 [Weissella confusa]|uniref:hypothetical protein n=1 Tax=Weissella confusa TaxID=1583 RepID=UPI001C6FBCF8|nr:hypothetical protein [Weissella confusa]QYU58917.1 hypothetical protein K1728_05820 [Weissella confusa]